MKFKNLRHLLVLATLAFLPSAFGQEAPKTFTVQNGSKPWYDRDVWTLVQVPDSLKSADAIPQQDCNSRSLTIPGTPASITIGVFEKDIDSFLTRNPTAQKTTDTIAVINTSAVTLKYNVFTLAKPSALIDGTGFMAGMLLLKITAK